jgi:HAD superfamily hydrolase (TIGR01484 family)
MDVIHRLLDKGIIFVACSGRQYRSERKLFAPVADRLLYITDGGTVVRTPKEILKVDTMPDEIWKGMLSMVHESLPSCDYYIATPDRGFAEDGGSRMFHWLRDSYGYDIQEISDPRILENQQIIKFSVYHPNACEELCAPVFTPAWKDKVTLVSAGKEWMDATLQGSGKGPALDFLQKHLGIAPDETCVFGDNINDIEMYKGRDLWIPREEAQELGEDEYYVGDLIGMDVLLENGEKFGVLRDVMETGANDVYVVEQVNGDEILLPAIHECILDVNVDENTMTVHLMKGLV